MLLGIQSGYYKGTNYDSIQSGNNIAIEFSSKISKNFSLTAHVNYGWNRYFESELSNNPAGFLESNGTNSDLFIIQAGILAGYSLHLSRNLDLTGYLGLSAYTEIITCPWEYAPMVIGTREYSFTDLAFPIKLNLTYTLFEKFQIGIAGGFYYMPYTGILGLHTGPQFGYLF